MARDHLAVPGTSSSSECAFSAGRHLITDSRCSLGHSTVTAYMCITDCQFFQVYLIKSSQAFAIVCKTFINALTLSNLSRATIVCFEFVK